MYNEWSDGTAVAEEQDVSSVLRRFDRKFERAQVPQRTFDEVPDGRYDVCVEDVELGQSRAGNPMIKWTLRIVGPNQVNRRLFKRRAITDNTLAFVKQELESCGVKVSRISDLPSHLDRMRGAEMPVVKISKNGDSNIYFNSTRKSESGLGRMDDDTPF